MKSFAVVACVTLWSGVAAATPTFPGVISEALQLDYQPSCNLCHASTSGGGPMATPFGRALVERGLRAGNEGSLRDALDQLAADDVDSNGNGVSDVADLQAGIDPNAAGNQSLTSAPAMEYGCVGQVARSSPKSGMGAAAVGLALGLLLTMRRVEARRLLRFPSRYES